MIDETLHVGKVLQQRSAERDVHDLRSSADRKDGHLHPNALVKHRDLRGITSVVDAYWSAWSVAP